MYVFKTWIRTNQKKYIMVCNLHKCDGVLDANVWDMVKDNEGVVNTYCKYLNKQCHKLWCNIVFELRFLVINFLYCDSFYLYIYKSFELNCVYVTGSVFFFEIVLQPWIR